MLSLLSTGYVSGAGCGNDVFTQLGSITDLGADKWEGGFEDFLPVTLDCSRFRLDVWLLHISRFMHYGRCRPMGHAHIRAHRSLSLVHT